MFYLFVLAVLIFSNPSLADNHDAPDYSDLTHWLCHADNPNFCARDQTTTVIHADGSFSEEQFRPIVDPGFDCFYVYPTVSMDPTGNSDLKPNREEERVIEAQFARYGAACRTFAPIYRQITLTSLRSRIAGEPIPFDGAMAYGDVKAAWQHYLAHENDGRGVILVGHSQGSGMLGTLIREEIEGKPIQNQIISAHLIGSVILTPPGKDVGGSFKHMPLCRKADQNQCIVTFASFRDTIPPPPNTRFGRARDTSERHLQAACNLPGAMSNGEVPLHAYLSASGDSLGSSSPQPPWTSSGKQVNTPFVSVPGLLSAKCVVDGEFSYLSVTVHGDPDDPRADDIGGNVVIDGEVAADWGLHLIDMHLAMGNLVHLAQQQGTAFLRTAGPYRGETLLTKGSR